EVGGVEGAVAVDEADDAVGGLGGDEAGEAGRTEAGPGFDDDGGAGRPGDGAGPVRRAIVDDDRPVAGGEGGQQRWQGGRFVEDGNDDVGHGGVVSGPRLRVAGEVLTIR